MSNQELAAKMAALNRKQRMYFNYISEQALFSQMGEVLTYHQQNEVKEVSAAYNSKSSADKLVVAASVTGGDDILKDFPC